MDGWMDVPVNERGSSSYDCHDCLSTYIGRYIHTCLLLMDFLHPSIHHPHHPAHTMQRQLLRAGCNVLTGYQAGVVSVIFLPAFFSFSLPSGARHGAGRACLDTFGVSPIPLIPMARLTVKCVCLRVWAQASPTASAP